MRDMLLVEHDAGYKKDLSKVTKIVRLGSVHYGHGLVTHHRCSTPVDMTRTRPHAFLAGYGGKGSLLRWDNHQDLHVRISQMHSTL